MPSYLFKIIIAYHALATPTGGAGCLHASQPQARQQDHDDGKKNKKICRPPAGQAWAEVLVRPGPRAADLTPILEPNPYKTLQN